MTASVNTSVFNTSHNSIVTVRRRQKACIEYIFTAEMEDYDGDIHTYEVMAETYREAAAKAEEIAWDNGISVYNMNIYK